MVDKIGSTTLATPSAETKRNDPARVKDAACQFESLLIGQMMKSMRESSTGWLSDGDEDQAGSTATDMAEEQFANALARQGGLGLARMVVSGLEKGSSSGS
jgi:Rod binding domain-containing protein